MSIEDQIAKLGAYAKAADHAATSLKNVADAAEYGVKSIDEWSKAIENGGSHLKAIENNDKARVSPEDYFKQTYGQQGTAGVEEESDLTQLTDLIVKRMTGGQGLTKAILGSGLGAYLDSLTKLLTELKDPKTKADQAIRDRQQVQAIERLIQMFYPGFMEQQFESAFNKVVAKKEREANERPKPPKDPQSASVAIGGGFIIRVTKKNGTPFIDILPDSGGDEKDWLKIQQSLGGIKGH